MLNDLNTVNFDGYYVNLYRLSGGRYVPRPDFAAYDATPLVNQGYKQGRTVIETSEPGLDPAIRRSGVDNSRNGQLAFRFHF
jgi:hypothetical protein